VTRASTYTVDRPANPKPSFIQMRAVCQQCIVVTEFQV